MTNSDIIEEIKDIIEASLNEMFHKQMFIDLDDMFACAQCFFDEFGVDIEEDELEAIVSNAAEMRH